MLMSRVSAAMIAAVMMSEIAPVITMMMMAAPVATMFASQLR